MKKIFVAAIIITALSIFGTGICPQPIEGADLALPVPKVTLEPQAVVAAAHSKPDETICMESMLNRTVIERVSAPVTESKSDAPAFRQAEVTTALPPQSATPIAADPYHTDIYPENIYSVKYEHDAEGNLIGKTTTYPTVFGSDAVWIEGRAYYNLPGFGLVEWGGPSSVTEDYTLYESGVKVGIMGGEDEAPAYTSSPAQSEEWPELTGEVIHQSLTEAPERNSTPPDYKPDTTPPDDPSARVIP